MQRTFETRVAQGLAEADGEGQDGAANGAYPELLPNISIHGLWSPVVRHEKDRSGSPISKAVGSDLLGDSLEPTQSGEGRKGVADANATEAGGAAGESEEHGMHHRYIVLLFLFGVLAIGCILTVVLERLAPSVPYTATLFVAGVLVSMVHYFKSPESWYHWPSWFASVEMWQAINPHLLFYCFLPGLIFGEAMRLNVQLVSKCCWQVLLLACPGVLMGTALTAYVGKFILPYGWDWPISFVFGAILSATDPVAVVALFNTLGVSPRLATLVSGESLVNDGTAIAVFVLMLKMVLGASLTPWGVVAFFGHMTLTAIALGTVVGLVAVAIIGVCCDGSCHSDGMVQAVVTICAGYLAFFIAESELSTSGVITVVTSGLVVANFAWPAFVSRETVQTVWEAIEFMGNTLIFFLAGVLFGDTVLRRWGFIGPSDFLWLLVLYVCLTLIRTGLVFLLWVPLNLIGSPLHWSEGLVVVWSGLRGAVSLAMAIIVDMEPGVSKQMGSRVMFHVGGIATLTFLVNATTVPALLRRLGLTKASSMRQRLVSQFATNMAVHTSEVFESQMQGLGDVRFRGANRTMVSAMVPTLSGRAPGVGPELSDKDACSAEGAERQLAKIYREAYLRFIQKHYWDAIETSVLSRRLRVARILLQSTDEALDHSWLCLNDWDVIARDIDMKPPTEAMRYIARLVECRPFRWIPELRRMFSEDHRTLRKVLVTLSFQEAHAHAQAEVPKLFGLEDPLDEQVQQQIAHESAMQCRRATELLELVPAEMVELGKSQMLARKLLHEQMEQVSFMRDKGLLTSAEAGQLEHQIKAAGLRVTYAPKYVWLGSVHGGLLPPGSLLQHG